MRTIIVPAAKILYYSQKLNLSKLTGIFENEEVLSMKVVLSLNEEHLKDIGIKLGDRINILKETRKFKALSVPPLRQFKVNTSPRRK